MQRRNLNLFLLLLSIFSLSPALGAQEVYDGGVIQKTVKTNQRPIAITSSNRNWEALAELAFTTHGGFRVTQGSDAFFTLKLIHPRNQAMDILHAKIIH